MLEAICVTGKEEYYLIGDTMLHHFVSFTLTMK